MHSPFGTRQWLRSLDVTDLVRILVQYVMADPRREAFTRTWCLFIL